MNSSFYSNQLFYVHFNEQQAAVRREGNQRNIRQIATYLQSFHDNNNNYNNNHNKNMNLCAWFMGLKVAYSKKVRRD